MPPFGDMETDADELEWTAQTVEPKALSLDAAQRSSGRQSLLHALVTTAPPQWNSSLKIAPSFHLEYYPPVSASWSSEGFSSYWRLDLTQTKESKLIWHEILFMLIFISTIPTILSGQGFFFSLLIHDIVLFNLFSIPLGQLALFASVGRILRRRTISVFVTIHPKPESNISVDSFETWTSLS